MRPTAAYNQMQWSRFLDFTLDYNISRSRCNQIAAISAFDCDEELDSHVQKYKKNREIVLNTLRRLGITKIAPTDGAFYVYVDLRY
jgi:aspartate/methionine/tyrosine aminotransferase